MKSPRPYAIIRPNHTTIADHYRHQLALQRIAKRIEQTGITFDIPAAEALLKQEYLRIERATACLDELLQFNSKAMVAFMGKKGLAITTVAKKWFWETRKAPLLIFEKGTERPQFNTALLQQYCINDRTKDNDTGEAASYLLELRAAAKTISFLENYLGFAYDGKGKIYGGFNPFGTVGERWSASASITRKGRKFSLNYQNIPGKDIGQEFRGRRIQLVQPLRNFFLPGPGKSWLCFDFDSQEARLLTIFSGDAAFQEMIDKNKKFHSQNAIDWFLPDILPNLPKTYEEFQRVKGDESHPLNKEVSFAYDAAKNYMYSVAYQPVRGELGADKYPAILAGCQKLFPTWSEEQVGLVVQRYFKFHPAILENYQRATKKEVLDKGYITHPLFGGRLYVEPPTTDPVTGHIKSSARGIAQGLNYKMQSGGFYIYSKALIAIEPQIDWETVAIGMTLHDEIGAFCPIGEETKWGGLIKDAMQAEWEYLGKKHSLPADFHIGKNWGQAKHAPKAKFKPSKS